MDAEGTVISNFYLLTEDGVNAERAYPMGGDTVLITTTSNNQYWPIVDNDNLSILLNASTGEVYNSFAFGSSTRDYPFEAERFGDNLVWAGLTNLYSTNDSTLGYITFSPIDGSGACPKNYAVSKGELVNFEPLVTDITFSEKPSLPISENLTAQTSTTFTLVGSCSAINSTFDTRNNCVATEGTFDQTLQKISDIAVGEIQLTVFDLSGRELLQTSIVQQLNSMILSEQLQSGMYIYAFRFGGCGNLQQVTGKLAITR
jgi:hypothetical protein